MATIRSILILCFSLASITLFTQDTLALQLRTHITQGINFLEKNQITETIEGTRYAGEWPTYMCLQRGFIMLGKKGCYEDSNCFSTTSIHNALAQIYLKFPEYKGIPEILDKAFSKIMSYRNDQGFNFWNLLPQNINLSNNKTAEYVSLVRRPTNYPLGSSFINNAANITEDADDTAHAYAAMGFRRRILSKTTLNESLHFNTDSLGILLDQYRDLDRNNRYWFNVFTGNDHDTGAFLTWLGQEHQLKKWNHWIEVCHNVIFYLPISKCYPHPNKPYIPYGTNNIDAVVNSNILSALAINNIETIGQEKAIAFLEKKSSKNNYRKVGSYYPNSYHFPYALSEAYANGVDGLKISAAYICENVLKNQKKDGSWQSKRNLNNRDRVQSTAYAINALINFGNYKDRQTKESIEKGIAYLLSKSIKGNDSCHWTGGVFFSGGTVVRNNLIWKSDAFTTVIIIKAFANYLGYLELS